MKKVRKTNFFLTFFQYNHVKIDFSWSFQGVLKEIEKYFFL